MARTITLIVLREVRVQRAATLKGGGVTSVIATTGASGTIGSGTLVLGSTVSGWAVSTVQLRLAGVGSAFPKESMARASIVREEPSGAFFYLYAEFRSKLLGFVDDLELLFDEKAGLFHVRSASRLGRRDFGVNRKRVELLRSKLQSEAS